MNIQKINNSRVSFGRVKEGAAKRAMMNATSLKEMKDIESQIQKQSTNTLYDVGTKYWGSCCLGYTVLKIDGRDRIVVWSGPDFIEACKEAEDRKKEDIKNHLKGKSEKEKMEYYGNQVIDRYYQFYNNRW